MTGERSRTEPGILLDLKKQTKEKCEWRNKMNVNSQFTQEGKHSEVFQPQLNFLLLSDKMNDFLGGNKSKLTSLTEEDKDRLDG